jgi:lipopolysaccharide export system protein LptA
MLEGFKMRRNTVLRLFGGFIPVLLAGLLICCPHARAANDSKSAKQPQDFNVMTNSKSPIHITADRMEANQDQRIITFDNHVIVTQDDVTITSNRLKVFLLPADARPAASPAAKSAPDAAPTADQKIDYIEFEGDVKVTQQDRLATASKAVFYQKDQKIVLHGRPVVTKGQNRTTGDLITIFLKENRSIVEGKTDTIFNPEKKE